MEILSEQFESISKDRTGPFMMTVKQYGIDKMRGTFNKLSATVESHHNAVKSLKEYILLANQSSFEMLRYTLFKIVENILKDCQEEFFTELAESQPTRLARVCCMLCIEIDELKRLIRSMFVKLCPPLMPKLFPEGLQSTEEFLKSLGFKFKATKDSKVS